MSDENFELEMFKNLDKGSEFSPIKNNPSKEINNKSLYYIIFYCKKSSDDIRNILNNKNLTFTNFISIDQRDINNIKKNEDVHFFVYNFEKKMIRALVKKDNSLTKINETENEIIKLESKNR